MLLRFYIYILISTFALRKSGEYSLPSTPEHQQMP